ncbi:MAG: hypothetical protein KF726_06340 [Anaerolineae bacterium]|nr:hypothetical protein [Anaerolineae bacterium]
MTVTVAWDNDEHTIILFTFIGNWTWREYWDACMQSNAMHATVKHRVYVIADLTASTTFPIDSPMYPIKTLRIAPVNAGTPRIAVNGGKIVEIVVKTFKRLYPGFANEYDIAPSLADARLILQGYIERDRSR